MLTSSIGLILIVSGAITALGGLIALLNPQFNLRSTYGIENPASIAVFLMRHWGVLTLDVGCLIVYSAYDPAIRVPVLAAAVAEKFSHGNCGRDFRYPLRAISCRLTKNQFRKLPSAVRPAPRFRIFCADTASWNYSPEPPLVAVSMGSRGFSNYCGLRPESADVQRRRMISAIARGNFSG
jgi:hypothetical protein